ncbi:hypothetical protein ACFQ2K_05230 [Streptomyces sanglieri]|uniref:Uncharacterized protein n=1 Tax=Streptomyces sanglieri TaxID=193460 RepID=A0ABW2WLA0_9ACTN
MTSGCQRTGGLRCPGTGNGPRPPPNRYAGSLSRCPARPAPGLIADEHRWVFDELIAPSHLRRVTMRPDPIYLIGEPGAGQLLAGRMLRRAMR